MTLESATANLPATAPTPSWRTLRSALQEAGISTEILASPSYQQLASPDRAAAFRQAIALVPPEKPARDEDLAIELAWLRAATKARNADDGDALMAYGVLSDRIRHFPIEVIRDGFRAYADKHPWWPTIAEILPFIEAQRGPAARMRSRLEGLANRSRMMGDQPRGKDAEPISEAQRAELGEKLTGLATQIEDKAVSAGFGSASSAPPGKVPVWKPPVPETLMSAHGISREEALIRIDRMTRDQLGKAAA